MEQGSDDIQALIALMARLPGLGPRSARRIVLQLVRRRSQQMVQLSQLLDRVAQNSRECVVCGNITDRDECAICTDPARATGEICVVQDVADLWALERGRAFRGRYHVLEGADRARHVVARFPSLDAAVACYHSTEYQAALAHAKGASERDLVIVEEAAPAPE